MTRFIKPLGLIALSIISAIAIFVITPATAQLDCEDAYLDVCIPRTPPDLDCEDIEFRNFRVLPPDPHQLDEDGNGIGCEAS
ncbi:MAG: hypothetical protein AAFQ57_02165 [Cyanobacteria bacterium J06626_14]